nr:MAG TPA: hypothetical protein [Caudoviricetes sp.]
MVISYENAIWIIALIRVIFCFFVFSFYGFLYIGNRVIEY